MTLYVLIILLSLQHLINKKLTDPHKKYADWFLMILAYTYIIIALLFNIK